ncbi:MAG: lysylphosphatidylglycerol synthase transmembrane domain-containing protein [Planctomycetia bacterium]|nr:lysylphosphatidylglycerol synthase transmembrane domain-containing protein [Planctomycetia bacterium]
MNQKNENQEQNPPAKEPQQESVLKDSIDYGTVYGLEAGLESGMQKGIRSGLREGIANSLINGAEEAVCDILSDEIPPAQDPPSGEEPDPAAEKNKKLRKRLIFWGKLLVIMIVLVWIGFRLHQSWNEISKYEWNLQYPWLIAACLIYLLAFFPAALFWYFSLNWMGQKPGFFQAIYAFYASQLGKYLPGKAMVVIIRSAMVCGEKVRTSIAAVCVFYETLTMMATGAFLSSLIVMIWFREHWFYSLMAFGAMILSGLPLIPPVFIQILHFLRIGKGDPLVGESLRSITWRSLAVGFGLMSLLWVLFGISLWAAIQGLGIVPCDFLGNLPRYISVTALAIVLGFAVPISPGGLGIREAVLAILLIPYFELILQLPDNANISVRAENLALIVSLEQRILSIIAELLLVFLFFTISMIHSIRKRNEKRNGSD